MHAALRTRVAKALPAAACALFLVLPGPRAVAQGPMPPGAADAPSIGRLRTPKPGANTKAAPPRPVARPVARPAPQPTNANEDARADAPAIGQSKIRFDQSAYDFGEAEASAEVEHEFVFHNDGDAPLVLQTVRPHCGCTVADWTREVPPGGRGVVKAKLRLRGFRGPVQKGIDVRSNDPRTPLVNLTIKGKVNVDIEITPSSRLFFGRVDMDAEAERVVTVTSKLADPLQITSVGFKTPDPEGHQPFTAEKVVVEEGRQYRFKVRTAPPLKYGAVGDTLVLKTDSTKHPFVEIPVTAYVMAPVTASPTAVTFSLSHPQYNRRPVYIRRSDGKPLKVLEADATPSVLEAAITPLADGKTQRIDLIMREVPDGKTTFGLVTIRTDAPEMPEIEVKVRFVK